ncbi:muramidase family protein [Enterococcus sp. LJL98]
MEKSLSRKERRKMEEQRVFYRHMKKSAAVLGTTVTAISVVAPLAPIATVFADETDGTIQSMSSDPIDTTEEVADSSTAMEETTETVEVDPSEAPEFSEGMEEEVQPSAPEVEVSEEEVPAVVEKETEQNDEVKEPAALPFANPLMRASASYVDPQAFINEVSIHAQPIANANDLYASVMIAQAIIESGWGRSTLSQAPNYNLFGIKGSYQGQTVYMSTQEYLNGQWVVKNEPFRKYPSFAESFADNAATLRNVSFQAGVYFYSGAWKSNTNSYRDATAWLTGRYATDPGYAGKLNGVIETYNLTRFDSPATGNGGGQGNQNTGNNSESNQENNQATGQEKTYTVKSGDSVWLIANNHGITMDQLRSWNNLKGDLIHPGQKLIVSQSGQTTPKPETPKPETPKPETPKPPTNSSAKTYTVKSGDSVWLIANNHGITMDQLRSWNNLKGDLIHPGQKLVVSQSGQTTPKPETPKPETPKPETPKPPTNSSAKTYTVKSGDSVWLIANNHGITMDQLRSWNNLKGDLIHPGQKLVVSQSSTGGTNTQPTPPANNNHQANTPKPSTPSTSQQYYTVKPGDSVWLIANNHGITMDQLRSWNNLKGDLIHPNQKIIVKKGTTSTAASNSTSGNQTTTTGNQQATHKIVSGDSLWALAQKYGVSVAKLKSLNHLTSDTIYVGQTLKVR